MLRKIYTTVILVIGFMSCFPMIGLSQVEFKIELLPDSMTYQVTFLPSVTWNPPFNKTSSSQVTIKAPTGGFTVSNTTSLISGVSWAHNATYVTPIEEPGYDYFSFGLTSLGTDFITYTNGVELSIFTFENTGNCTGPVELMQEGDLFSPPNSQNGNVGNQLTTFGGGAGVNVWNGNYDIGGADCCGGLCGGNTSTCDITGVTSNNATDCNANNGNITIMATGSSSLEYRLNGGAWQNNNVFTNLSAGNYNAEIRLTDNSCTTTYSGNPIVISEPGAPSVGNVSVTGTSDCNVGDGSISITATGGTGTYQYSLDGNSWQNDNTFNNLNTGSYQLWVRNSNLTCEVLDGTATVSAPASPSVPTGAGTNPAVCGVDDGSITISASGGVGPLQYSLDGVNWTTNNEFNNLGGGIYEIYVRNNDQSCAIQGSDVVLIAPNELNISVTANDPTVCNGTDGSIQVTASGGVPPYAYSIDNGGSWQNSGTFSNLAGGTYTVLVENNDGSCQTSSNDNPVILTAPTCPGSCEVEYILELLPNGHYQVSLLPDVTWTGNDAITSTAQVTILAPTGGFQVSNLINLIPNVIFSNNVTYTAPTENPLQDYFLVGLTTQGTMNIPYVQGQKVPLFTFENGGTCTGNSIYLMNNETDPFFPPNTQNANAGQQLTTVGSGQDAEICVSGDGVDCITPMENTDCLVAYQLELLSDGVYQVSLIPDTTWNSPQNLTSSAQVTIVAPTNGLQISNLTNLVPGANFDNNSTYYAPPENTSKDYFLFGLVTNGTMAIPYQEGQKVPLFTFENGGTCTGDSIYLMPIEGDPFAVPNSLSANTGQQLTTLGGGIDVNICIFGESAACVACGPNMLDSDDDGICDNEENMNGTDPFDPCDPDITHPNCDFECPEWFTDDLIYWDLGNGPAEVCADFPATDAHLYDIIVNQEPYAQPVTSCSFDTLIFYTYAFTVGQGNDGPYEVVSWEANGQIFSAPSVANMDELAALMETWDAGGNWINTPNFSAISGGHENGVYGNMTLRHISSQVNTFIQLNYTLISTSSTLELSDLGVNEVIISDDQCADTIYVEIYDPQTEEIIDMIPVDSSEWNHCLDVSELPNTDYTVSICEDPENGTLTIDGTCLNYVPDGEYNGNDTICVVVCSDTNPPICDTTIIVLEIEQYVCEDIYDIDSLYLQGTNGTASMCVPIALNASVTYDIIVDQAPYSGPILACDYDTLVFFTYSFIVGQGEDGPYEIVSWEVNGQTFSTASVQTMTDLANQMDIWDPTGNWTNSAFFSAIHGGGMNTVYGPMIIRHIGSNVSSTIQPNQTYLATGTEIEINGLGWHEVVFGNQLNNCLDTVYVNIIEPEIETEIVFVSPDEETIDICLDSDELPGTPASISYCGLPSNGISNSIAFNCIDYSPNPGFYGEDQICVVICDDSENEGPFCDTTYINIIVLPPNDTTAITINPIEETEFCLDDFLQFPGTPISGAICNEDLSAIDAEISNGTCVTIDPVDDFVGNTDLCVVYCYATDAGEMVCDTTFIDVFVPPFKDTVNVIIDDFEGLDTCLNEFVTLPGNFISASICGENTDEVNAEMDGFCVNLVPAFGFTNGTSEVCVVICDDSSPSICDTTVINILVDVNCPEIIDEEVVYTTSGNYCASIAPDDFDLHEIIVNGSQYTFPTLGCDEDNLVFYSYAFVFGQGNIGPYELVSWEVDGVDHSGIVQNMNQLAALMNSIDGSSVWTNNTNTLSFNNTPSPATYGNMVIRHIATNTQTLLLPNSTVIAQGSLVQGLNTGLNELVLIDPNTGCSDTVHIWSIDNTTDIISTETPFETTTDEICLDDDHLPGNITLGFCEVPSNGILTFTADNCFVYEPSDGFSGIESICILQCSDVFDQNGVQICDTTYIEILVYPNVDYTEVVIPNEETQFCLDDYLDIDAIIISSGVCNENLNELDITTNNTSCISINPIAGFVGNSDACVYHCYDLNGTVVCDTTYITIIVLPPTDTIFVDIEGFDPVDVCLDNNTLQLAGNFIGGTICDENIAAVDATLNANGCITLDPADLFIGTSEVCVIHCDDNSPSICDTTYIMINVTYPCEEIYQEDTIFVDEPKVCLPIPLANIGTYNIILNGTDYTSPPLPCDQDSLVYYTYSFSVGGGNDGPYEVQWNINGNNFFGIIQDMNELTAWMNQHDPNGIWINDPSTASISNDLTDSDYGTMILTHEQTDIPAFLLPNYTAVAYGSCVQLSGVGLHELIIIDTNTGCADTVYVWYVENEVDIIEVTTDYGVDVTNICVDTTDLPGNILSINLCNAVVNGAVTFNEMCLDYSPNIGFSGLEEICVIICDDTPAPDGPFCDTTYIQITVEEQNCPELFTQSTYTIPEIIGTGHGDFCVPLSAEDFDTYEIIVNGAPYMLPHQPCNVDTLVFYTYSFTLGAGSSGPYELTNWSINGNNFSGTVQDMNELVALMNQFDPNGNWINDPTTLSVSGGSDNTVYGNMIITHIGTGIPAILLPNFTPLADGSSISLPVGTNEVIFINEEDGCEYEIIVIVEPTVAPSGVLVNSRVFLQGAYQLGTNQMSSNLRQMPSFPLIEPYSNYNPIPGVFRFVHVGGGGETIDPAILNVAGADAIVDWVFLELRSGADSVEVVATRAALLQSDGDIVDVDGFSPVLFDAPEGDYFLAIRHRNHLGIMSSNALSLSDVVTSIDFTNLVTDTYGGINARKVMTDGTPVMWGGDANGDGNLIFQGFNNDPDAVLFTVLLAPGNISFDTNYIVDGYSGSDTSMDGQTIYQGSNNDVGTLIFFNVLENPESNFIINYVVSEKLPQD